MDWSNAKVFEFLELYEGEPAIWDQKHRLHKNNKKVQDAWARISASFNVSIDELKGKKNSLMATFRSHRRRIEASMRAGAKGEDIYQPIWFAYQRMEEFLAPVYDSGSTTSTAYAFDFDETADDDDDKGSEMDNESIANIPVTTTAKRKRPEYANTSNEQSLTPNHIQVTETSKDVNTKIETLMNIANKLMKEGKEKQESEQIFAAYIADKLKKIKSPQIRQYTEDGILNVLSDGLNKQLQYDSEEL